MIHRLLEIRKLDTKNHAATICKPWKAFNCKHASNAVGLWKVINNSEKTTSIMEHKASILQKIGRILWITCAQ